MRNEVFNIKPNETIKQFELRIRADERRRIIADLAQSNHSETVVLDCRSDITEIKQRYEIARIAEVGDIFDCPVCRRAVKKKGSKIFCSNSRNKRNDGGNCSDDYHNIINPDRRNARKKK